MSKISNFLKPLSIVPLAVGLNACAVDDASSEDNLCEDRIVQAIDDVDQGSLDIIDENRSQISDALNCGIDRALEKSLNADNWPTIWHQVSSSEMIDTDVACITWPKLDEILDPPGPNNKRECVNSNVVIAASVERLLDLHPEFRNLCRFESVAGGYTVYSQYDKNAEVCSGFLGYIIADNESMCLVTSLSKVNLHTAYWASGHLGVGMLTKEEIEKCNLPVEKNPHFEE